MRWQTTLVAAILLALVGGFYYWYEVRLGPDREKAETRKGRVFTAVDTADVMAVELKRPDGVVKASREAENWQLLEPVKFPFGDRMVTRFAFWQGPLYQIRNHHGQLVVYLRMNGIVPPTTARRPA